MRRLLYSCILGILVATLAFGAEVRKITEPDIEWGDPSTTVTSSRGHTGNRIPRYWDNNAFTDNLTLYGNDIITKGPWVDVRASDTLALALDNAANKTLLVASAVSVTDNTTIPSTVSVVVLKGGSFSISDNVTLSILGPLDAGLYRIFAGNGTVSFGGGTVNFSTLREVYPEWWGLIGNDTTTGQLTINSTAIQAAIESVKTDTNGNLGGAVQLQASNYYYDTTIHIRRGIAFRGRGWSATTLIYMGNGKAMDLIPGASDIAAPTNMISRVMLNDFGITTDTAYTPTHGIYIEDLIRGIVKDVHVGERYTTTVGNRRFSTAGIELKTTTTGDAIWNVNFDRVGIENISGTAGLLISGQSSGVWASAITIKDGWYEHNTGPGILSDDNVKLNVIMSGNVVQSNDGSQMELKNIFAAHISGNYFEPEATNSNIPVRLCHGSLANGLCEGLAFTGNIFWSGNPTVRAAADLDLSGGATASVIGGEVSGNSFNSEATAGVKIGSSVDVSITGNYLRAIAGAVKPLLDTSAGAHNNIITTDTRDWYNDNSKYHLIRLLGNRTGLQISSSDAVYINKVPGYLVFETPKDTHILGYNSYYDADTSKYKYRQTGYGFRLRPDTSGNLIFDTAPSGTAGDNVTFTTRVTLGNIGDLTVGTAGKGVVLTNAAGTVTKRVRLNDAGDGLIYENP